MLQHKVKFVIFLCVFLVVVILFVILPCLHAYLSQSCVVSAKTLVVQGWIFDTMMDQAVAEFERGNYERVIVTGVYQTAERGKNKLINRGVNPEIIDIASSVQKKQGVHNTFSEALGLKKHLREKASSVGAINIVTSSVHGKKTLVIFKKVLGDSVNVGVITCRSNYYNQDRLWASSLGIKVTVRFFIGYLYALVWNFREN